MPNRKESCVASFLILTAAGFFLAGIYNYLALMSIAAALLIVAMAALVLALIYAGVAKWLTVVAK